MAPDNQTTQPATLTTRWWGLLVGGVAVLLLLLLSACQSDPADLPDQDILATATHTGFAPYGSRPHTHLSATATVTGTPPTATRTATPTRPPRRCDFCTMPPAPSHTPAAWPSGIVTETPRPDQPTITPEPTDIPILFPTLPPATALPAAVGVLEPTSFGSLEGNAKPGGVAVNPRTGQAAVIWSQLDPDPGQETAGRVYLRLSDPVTHAWQYARSVQGPGIYKIGKSAPESAVGIAPNGTLYVAYVRSDGANAYLEWRASADGTNWTAPADFPYASANNELYNVRMTVDANGEPHVGALIVPAGMPGPTPAATPDDSSGAGPDPVGDLVYYERLADGRWRQEYRPVSGRGQRQYAVALTTFALPDGTIRTLLVWSEGAGLAPERTVYTSYKDGPAGAWSRPLILSTNHPTIPDYEAGFGTGLQVLAFPYGGQAWVFCAWSLYSTGYLGATWSADGGVQWQGESALAYNPIASPPGATVAAHLHSPIPYWSAATGHLLVAYQFCARAGPETGLTRPNCFPAFTYARPGAAGTAVTACRVTPGAVGWQGCEDVTHPPLRLFAGTMMADTRDLTGINGLSDAAYLLWDEGTGSRELYLAGLDLGTLLSGQEEVTP